MTQEYIDRSLINRFGTFAKSTMNLVGYFMALGDAQEAATIKMQQLSAEISTTNGGCKFDYVLGDLQPLFDAINASTLPFMDAAAKAYVIGELSA